ncbi:MAG: NAD(P)H-hydrate dehydratase, partial [Hyphomicrobiales bacterium]|nr:NAD(P)H-hydrate dehydratase [Hyphomicrobiales bacterium]
DIGIDDAVLARIGPKAAENNPDLWEHAFPVPRVDGHKFTKGHAVVVSGEIAATGAARLSARGALRGGAGLVTMASPRDALAVNAAALTAVMVRPVDTVDEFASLIGGKVATCIIGPGAGVGAKTCGFTEAALAAKRSLVLDADALTSFADAPDRLFDLIKADPNSQVVLTPHQGEFARIFNSLENEAEVISKLDRVVAAAVRSGAVVLLKGPDTVVASPDGRAAIAANAPPWLATAGSGDVLAGLIGAFLAQGVPAYEAACIGVWMHGEAGSEAGPGLIAEDLTEVMPAVFRRLFDRLGIPY